MARKFLGSNTQTNSRELFNNRARYRNFAISDKLMQQYPGIIRNFWFLEHMYYGRIDALHRTVVVDRNKLVSVSRGTGPSVMVLDFVANAFNDLAQEQERGFSSGKIRKDDFLNEVVPAKGYNSPLKAYDLHFNKLYNQVSYKLRRNHSSINNFNDFIDYFIEYLFQSKRDLPMTFTGFMSSRFSSPLSTGLFIDISNANYGDDSAKVENFIDTKNFNFFMKNCEKHGFMIDKNIPWRLCANVGSAEMEKYMAEAGTSFENLFESHYYKPHGTFGGEMKYFMDYMRKYYNRFIAIKPHVRKEEVVGGRIHRYVRRRKPETAESVDKKYGDPYRLGLYADMRNKETGYRYSDTFVERLKHNAESELVVGGTSLAYDYIDRAFRGFLNDPGAHNGSKMAKMVKRQEEDYDGQKMESVLKASVADARRTIY